MSLSLVYTGSSFKRSCAFSLHTWSSFGLWVLGEAKVQMLDLELLFILILSSLILMLLLPPPLPPPLLLLVLLVCVTLVQVNELGCNCEDGQIDRDDSRVDALRLLHRRLYKWDNLSVRWHRLQCTWPNLPCWCKSHVCGATCDFLPTSSLVWIWSWCVQLHAR